MRILHMSGAGNDFMVMDARGGDWNFEELAQKLCAMSGADGFMAVDTSDLADFRLHFYNADGSRGEMCGNGARCICKFAFDLGIAGAKMTVQTDAGIVEGWRMGEEQFRVKLNNPGVVDLNRIPDAAYVELGDPGVPHCLTEVVGLAHSQREELRPMAEKLRHHPAFPKGANVNFYCFVSDRILRILTYERGVEDYTLACGTGSGSLVAALWMAGKIPAGEIEVENPGGTLIVTVSGKGGKVTDLYLEGPAKVVGAYDI